jgi:hypothetical protein
MSCSATAQSAPAATLVALETTSQTFGAPLAMIQAAAETSSDNSAGVESASAAPNASAAGVSPAIAQSQATPAASAIGLALSDATEPPQPAVPENPPPADPGGAEVGRGGSDLSTAVLTPRVILPADPSWMTVTSGPARCGKSANDWLDELVNTDAAEAAELARRLVPFTIAAGLGFVWRSYRRTGRKNGRWEDRLPEATTVC